MEIRIVHATEHMPETYRDYLDGYRAVQLIAGDGRIRGELVWRLAGRWYVKFEIKEIGLFDAADRRQGWGTRLLEAALEDMRVFARQQDGRYQPWLVYLFCEAKNLEARAFYRARGFTEAAMLPEFDGPGETAVLYTRSLPVEP